MNCQACGWDKSVVLRTESWPEWRIRKRKCLRCSYMFTTYEMLVYNLALLEAASFVSKTYSSEFKDYIKQKEE